MGMRKSVSYKTVTVPNETVGTIMKQRDYRENHTKNAPKNTGHFESAKKINELKE